MIQLNTLETGDGSPTCYNKEVGEHYHNRAGAYTEALLTHVEPSGVIALSRHSKTIAALDVPFGLGYNSLAFIQELLRGDSRPERVEIVGIELDADVVHLVEEVLKYSRFELLRQTLGANTTRVVEAFSLFRPTEFSIDGMTVHLCMLKADMRKAVPDLVQTGMKFDAIWHDPFSPNKMPELWTVELFQAYRAMLAETGRLSTYSVSVTVRGALRESGFQLYRSTAVGVKSGGTVACASRLDELPDDIFELSQEEKERLDRKTVVPYRDRQFLSTRAEIRQRRDFELDSIKKRM